MEMGAPTDERGRKLRGRAPELLFHVEWKDWPNLTTCSKEPFAKFGDFKALADAYNAEWDATGKPGPPTEAAN